MHSALVSICFPNFQLAIIFSNKWFKSGICVIQAFCITLTPYFDLKPSTAVTNYEPYGLVSSSNATKMVLSGTLIRL